MFALVFWFELITQQFRRKNFSVLPYAGTSKISSQKIVLGKRTTALLTFRRVKISERFIFPHVVRYCEERLVSNTIRLCIIKLNFSIKLFINYNFGGTIKQILCTWKIFSVGLAINTFLRIYLSLESWIYT